MPFTEETVMLERVHLEDKTFLFSTESDIGALATSIARLGVMHSPYLQRLDSGYRIVCGFRRIAACIFLDFSEISARLLSPDTDKLTCVQLAIADNSQQHPLNLIETSRALVLLSEVCPNTDDLCQAAGALGLPDNFSVIYKLRQLSALAPEIQQGVLDGVLSMAMALELGQMEPSCGIGLTILFGYLKLGLNKQRELLTMMQEIAFREHLSIRDILNSTELQQIVVHEKWDRSQKTVQLRKYLRSRRYPSITVAESNFASLVQSLELESGISLVPPRDFEGNTFSFHINFNHIGELRRRLSHLAERSSCSTLSEILNGCRITH